MPPSTPLQLVRAGDADAREQLFREWLPVVLQWCRRLGGPRVDADDAAHDVMLILLTRLDALRDDAAFGSFVFGCTRRVLARHRRVAWVRRWTGALGFDAASDGESPERTSERNSSRSAIARAIDTLGADHREVIVLFELEERSVEEVAALLGVPVGTVKSRLSRARARLADALDAGGGGWTV